MNFEDWFKTQDFYLNMRFKYGDNLFNKNGDIYQIATVNMIKLAFDYCGKIHADRQLFKNSECLKVDTLTKDWIDEYNS